MPTALITGASSGIGESFAKALAQRKHDLILVARRKDKLQEVAARARGLGASRTEIVTLDLAHAGAATDLQASVSKFGMAVDFLVNNAGFGTTGRFDRMPLEREVEEIELNVTALVALTRLFLPGMIEHRRGTIINVASTAAFQPVPYMATYGATKAFVLSFSEALATEAAGSGVHILALCPGPVRTEFQAVAKNEHGLIPSFTYMDPDTVVEQALASAARGRAVRISGVLNTITAQSTRLLPRALVRTIAGRIYRDVAEGQS
jgi:uncharacterized protein